MQTLFVDIDVIIVSGKELLFEKDAIHNLYRINKQLNWQLIIVKKNSTPVTEQAIALIKNESIPVEVMNEPDKINTNSQYITKDNFLSWDDVYKMLKSSARTVHHARSTNETKIEIGLNVHGTGEYNI